MVTYNFTGAVAYDRLGSSWRTAAGLRSVTVIDPTTGILPTNLIQAGVAVSWLTADANSRYSFSCDAPGVVVDFGAGAEALYANEVPGLAVAAGGATNTAIDARMKWAPTTAYTLNQQVISPNGDVVKANVAHTSAAAYVTDVAKWTLSSTFAPLGGVPVLLVGAGIDYTGVTDSTTAMQAILTANPGVTILMENGVLTFSSLTLSKGQRLKGSGWRDYRDLPGLFGNAGWMVASTFSGTVLRSTATTGNAITIVDTAVTEGSLSDFILIGPGTGTSVGIYVGSSTMSVVHPVWHNIKVGNFATGVTTTNINEGSFYDLTINGCTLGLSLFTSTNQNAFYGLDLQRNVDGVQIDSTCYTNTFYTPIAQSNTGTGFLISGNKTLIVNPYLENNTTRGIDVVTGTGTTIISPHLNAAGDSIRVQAAATSVSILGFKSTGGTITNAGTNTYLQGTLTGFLTDTGTGTVIVDGGYSGSAFGPWSGFTPTLGGTGWAIGNGSIVLSATTIGKTVHLNVTVTFGTTSTFGTASPTITLPYTAAAVYGSPRATILRQGVGSYQLAPIHSSTSLITVWALGTNGAFTALTATNPASFAATDVMQVYSTYQRA